MKVVHTGGPDLSALKINRHFEMKGKAINVANGVHHQE